MTKLCSKCKENKGLYDFGRQTRSKDGLHAWCNPCKKSYNSAWFKENRKSENERLRDLYEETRAEKIAKNKIWQKSNPGAMAAITAKRRSKKKSAAPKWLTTENLKDIKSFYEKASLLTLLTGIKHEVDHIVPLQGRSVSGLHVPWNLQILTKSDNLSKGNTLGKQS